MQNETSGYTIYIQTLKSTGNEQQQQRITGNKKGAKPHQSREFVRLHLTFYTSFQQEEI